MKTFRLKAILVTCMVAVFAITGISKGGDNPGGGAASSTVKFQKENSDINSDVSNVQFNRNRVSMLKERLKKDCKAGNDETVVKDRKDLAKAKADLKRDRAYLAAD